MSNEREILERLSNEAKSMVDRLSDEEKSNFNNKYNELSVFEHDEAFDDDIPDTFEQAVEKAQAKVEPASNNNHFSADNDDNKDPFVQMTEREQHCKKMLPHLESRINYSSEATALYEEIKNSFMQEVLMRETYRYGTLLDTKESRSNHQLAHFNSKFMDEYNYLNSDVRAENLSKFTRMCDLAEIKGVERKDLNWYLYKRLENEIKQNTPEAIDNLKSQYIKNEKLENIITDYEIKKAELNINKPVFKKVNLADKLSKIKTPDQQLREDVDRIVNEYSQDKKELKTDKENNSTPDEDLFEEYSKLKIPAYESECNYGHSKMLDVKRMKELFNYDLKSISRSKDGFQRVYKFVDGSMALESRDKFSFKTKDASMAAENLVKVAKEKGWKKIELTGGKAFLEQSYLKAYQEGIRVNPVDDVQREFFEQLNKKHGIKPITNFSTNEVSVKNVEEEEVSVKNASEKKHKKGI